MVMEMHQRVVLIHGYFKNYKDMMNLKKNLEALGYECITVDLPLTFESIEHATSIFENKMQEILFSLGNGKKISLVGHSSGGLVIRLFLSNTEYIRRIHRCVLVATPNKGSRLADIAWRTFPPFVKVFKTLYFLREKSVKKLNLYCGDQIEIGVIAGNRSNLLLGKLLKGENDGRVGLSSALYERAKECIVLPYNHNEIHHRFKTAKLIDCFLRKGSFYSNR